jgi:long-chain acyl-CoA synthetase
MHPSIHAAAAPDRAAIIMSASGLTISYKQLDAASNRCAHLYRQLGLDAGDVVAVMLDNDPVLFELVWAAQRSGLYVVPVSSRLTASEVDYILRDSDAKLFVTSRLVARRAGIETWSDTPFALYMTNAAVGAYECWADSCAGQPSAPISDERAGGEMLYSSGTTGHPKGVKHPLPEDPDIAQSSPLMGLLGGLLRFDSDMTYLCPAPLYHAAPLRWSMAVHRFGGTVVVMDKFDPEDALQAIQTYQVSHSQWVPTHFIRMLKLPKDVRKRYDLSTLRLAVHAAAPCPVPVKEAMIDWWGPILIEYYGGTEGNGLTLIDTAQWLAHRGSVGKAVSGKLHILDDDGHVLPPRLEGLVYFEGGATFEYHNDPAKTEASRNNLGWSTLGDIGWVDEEGYLYLTDRKNFMIISGGVNIYPQEIENLLVTHPKVLDAAVIGAPDADMGEKVVAVIQPMNWDDSGPALAEELATWLRPQLSGVKMPRQFDFRRELPRHATGKLYKRLLRDEYQVSPTSSSQIK